MVAIQIEPFRGLSILFLRILNCLESNDNTSSLQPSWNRYETVLFFLSLTFSLSLSLCECCVTNLSGYSYFWTLYGSIVKWYLLTLSPPTHPPSSVLLWDLSAAFDTLNIETLCNKLKIYGFDKLSCDWFRLFLTGRSQRVKIGRTLSSSKLLESGVPQGGIL